ncbi:MAG: DUF1565 domain-containing protein [Chitinophagales bacterium]|nr:DUF1565 domain-containing protein [Chitinophagales bacterium]
MKTKTTLQKIGYYLFMLFSFVLSFTNVKSQTTYYVNDASLVGDVISTAIGSDLNAGTANAPFATLTKANSVAVSGDIIIADAGTYEENGFTIKSGVTLSGVCASKSIFIVKTSSIVISSNSELSRFTITRQTNSDVPSISVATISGGTGMKIKNCIFLKNRSAIYVNSTTASSALIVNNNDFDDNRTGMVLVDATFANITISNNNLVKSRSFGIIFTAGVSSLSNINISNNNFADNQAGGIGIEGTAVGGITLTNNWFGTATPNTYSGVVNGGFSVDAHNVISSYPYNFTDLNGAPDPNYPNDIAGGGLAGISSATHASSAIAFNLPTCGVTSNDPVSWYPTIPQAISGSNVGAIITASPGTYDGQVIINKAVTVQGTDSSNTIIAFTGTPSGVKSLFTVTAQNVTIKNFTFLVDLVRVHSGITSSGNVSGLTIEGNTIKAAYTSGTTLGYGTRNAININLFGTANATPVNSEPLIQDVVIKRNTIDTASGTGSVIFRSGISADRVRNLTVGGNNLADGNNFVSSINHDVITRFYYGSQIIKNNSINGGGVDLSTPNGDGVTEVSNNTFNGVWSKLNKWHMVRVLNGRAGRTINITDNQFIDQKNSITIENTKNVLVDNNTFTGTVEGFRLISVNTKLRVNSGSPSPLDTLGATIINNVFNTSGIFTTGNAVEFLNFDNQPQNHYLLGTIVLGSQGNENTFNENIPQFIYLGNIDSANTQDLAFYTLYPEYNDGGLAANTTTGYWTKDINAGDNYFYVNGGLKLAKTLNTVDATAAAALIFDKTDDVNIGLITYVTPNIHNLTTNTYYYTIQSAVNAATAYDTLMVSAGTFAENVTVNKPLTIIGEDSATTILDKGDGNYSAVGGNGFSVTANDVSISKVKIRNYTNGVSNTVDVSNLSIDEATIVENFGSGFYSNKSLNGLSITNSTFKNNGYKNNVHSAGSRRGIMTQSSSSDLKNIVITDNIVTDNSLVGIDINLNRSTNGINISNNTTARNGDDEIGVWLGNNNKDTSGAVIVANNNITLSNAVRFGIEIKNPSGTGDTTGIGSIFVKENIINTVSHTGANRDMGGIVVIRRKDGYSGALCINDQPKGVVVYNNTVSVQNIHANLNDAYGIVAGGTEHVIYGNTITNTEIPIQVQKGNDGYLTNNSSNQANVDFYFNRDNSADACAAVSNNTITGSGDVRLVTDIATSTTTLTGVTNVTANGFFCSIQSAIDLANDDDIIIVAPGTYAEDLFLHKRLSLRGANYGINPNVGPRVPETILTPFESDPDNTSTIYIDPAGSGSTIDGFTFNGDNPLLTSGVLINEGLTDVDAVEAISAYEGLSNVTVQNNIIKNYPYAAIDFYNYYNAGNSTTGNLITNNLIKDIRPTGGYGIGVIIYNNCYTNITNNVIDGTMVGVQTGNFYKADAGISHSISNNTITSYRKGIWYNGSYSNATKHNIENNIINTYTGAPNNWGIHVTSIGNNVSANINNNQIYDAKYGYNLWNNTTSDTITINGGIVGLCKSGIVADNFEGYQSNANSSYYKVSNVTIANCDTAIVVRDAPENSNSSTVGLLIADSTNSSVTPIALYVTGSDASVKIMNTNPNIYTYDGNILNVSGNPIDATDGDVLTNGTSTYITGGGTFRNYIMNNFTSNTITSGVGNEINITNTYNSISSTGSLTTNDNLILKSTAAGSASIGQSDIFGAYINGNVKVERYIPAKASRKWIFLASPITQSFADGWQQQIHITGNGTGGTVCPSLTPHSNGFDATIANSPSVYAYDASKTSGTRWTAITSTLLDNTNSNTGFRVNIRGPRSLGCSLLDGTMPPQSAVVLSTFGEINSANKNAGNFTLTYNNAKDGNSTDKYVMIANPYPSAISFGSLRLGSNATKIANNYAIYLPANNAGVYTYWDGIAGELINGDPDGNFDNTKGDVIASGQAFFVESTVPTDPTFTLDFFENQKSTETTAGYFRSRTINDKIRISLNKEEKIDEIIIRYVNDANVNNNEKSSMDIASINSGTFINSIKANKGMAIQTRDIKLLSTDEVWLNIGATQSGNYTLNFSEFENFAVANIYLVDHLANTIQNIKDNPEYVFSVDVNTAATKGATRFSIVFNRGEQPIVYNNIKMYPNPANKQVTLLLPQSADNNYTIKVTDMAGKIVLQQKAMGGTEQLSVDKLTTGTYIVEIIDSKGNRTTEKLIKN